MARPRRPDEPSTYQAQPEVPTELRRRFDVVRAVLGERMTISDAARELSMARVNMQSIVHRAEAAILSSLQPRPTGPTPTPPAQKAMETELERLQNENAKLKKQLAAADEMMGAAGEIIRSLRGLAPAKNRSSTTRSAKSKPSSPPTDEDPERATTTERAETTLLSRAVQQLSTTNQGARVARMLGMDLKTLKRWMERLARGEPLIRRRGGVMQPGSPEAEQRVRTLVIDLHGLPGAASLAHSVDGVSRRRAGQIKHEVQTALERERQHACHRVEVTAPGVLRGFDAMHLPNGFALTAADGCVPFRTTVKHVASYDANHVAAVLDEDFERHGAPLVIRQDRASCHTAAPVVSVLERHGVLLLQGPAYYPRYYGQHERQNREHRAWLDALDSTHDTTQQTLERMKTALNELWVRPTLDWRTAAQCWKSKTELTDDRAELHDEVQERAAHLRAHDVSHDLAMRLAIEQALIKRGYLRVITRRQPLCD